MNMISRRAIMRAIGMSMVAAGTAPASAAIDHAAPGNGHIPVRASLGPYSTVPWRHDADLFIDDLTIASFDGFDPTNDMDAYRCAEIMVDDWRDDYDFDVAYLAPRGRRDDARAGWSFRVIVTGPDVPSFARDVGFENLRTWRAD